MFYPQTRLFLFFVALIIWLVSPALVLAAPDVISITPDEGPEAGGTAVTVEGTGFESVVEATFVKNEGDDDVRINSLANDDNFIYATGYYRGTLTIEGTQITSAGSDDWWVAKFDTDGNLEWLRSGGSATSEDPWGIAVDSLGNVYVSGAADANMTFGALSSAGFGSSDAALVKYDADGTEQWLRVGGGTGFESGDGLYITDNDEIFTSGSFSGSVTFGAFPATSGGGSDAYVAEYDVDGNVQQLITGGGISTDRAQGVTVDTDGNILMAGESNSATLTFGAHSDTGAGSNDAFVAKFNSAGVAQWLRMGGGTSSDTSMSVVTDSNDNVYTTGTISSAGSFGSINVSSGTSDFGFVTKYSPTGTEEWVRIASTTDYVELWSVQIDAQDNLYVSGGYYSDLTWGTTTITAGSGGFTGKLDSSGNYLWAKNGDSDDWAYTFDSTIDSAGNVYTGGQFWPDVTFDSITVSDPDANNYFLVKYEPVSSAVTIGGATCSSLSYVSATELTCSTPAGTAGAVDVVVTNPDTSTDTLIGGFTYTGGAPDPSPTPTPEPSPTPTPTPTPTPEPSPVTAGAAHIGGPEDNAVLTTDKPTFSWTAPAEPQNVSAYMIFIDGVSFFGDLPKESKETDDYILVYDSSNNSFLLQSKKTFEDGTYTWYVRSKSTTGQTTDTSTRTFTVGSGDATTPVPSEPPIDQEIDDDEPAATTGGMLRTTAPETSTPSSGSVPTEGDDENNVQGIFSQINMPSFPVISEATQTALSPLKPIAPVAPVALAVVAPVLVAAAVAVQMGGAAFSPGIFAKIFQALGLFNFGAPQGLVFDSATHAPIPFALLTIASADKNIQETSVTDVHGVYKGVKLPPGTYSIQVGHQEFAFPTRKQRPGYLTPQDYYVGAPFTVKSARTEQLFLIPMDNRGGGLKAVSLATRFKHFALWALRNQTLIMSGFFIFSALMTILSPTPINILLTVLYAVFLGYKALKAFRRPMAAGVVTDAKRKPIAKAILKFVKPDVNQLAAVVMTNADGSYQAFVEPGMYQMMVIKPGYVWNEGGSPLSFTEQKLTKPKKLNVTLQSQQNVYDEMLKASPQVTPSLA